MSQIINPSGWHLKKEIQLGHIITTLTVAVSVVVYVNKLEQRIAIIETQIASQRDRDERQDKQTDEAMRLLRAQLEKMDAKLDRIIEGRK